MIKEMAHAKLNLNLHIFPDLKFKKETGYYPIHFINCELELHDDLYLEKQEGRVTFTCDNKQLSNDENLVYKAALLLKKEINNAMLGVKITLRKRIPIKAGLGGGSSDAAATIRGLLKLWEVTITPSQQARIIDSLGSDVFYFMKGGLCEVLGKGESIIGLSASLPKLWAVLIIPSTSKPSTAWMYKNVNLATIGLNINKIKELKNEILKKRKIEILNSLYNDFDEIINNLYPNLESIKKDLSNSGSERELIAGSGLTVVGFYRSKQSALTAYKNLQVKYKNIIWTHTN